MLRREQLLPLAGTVVLALLAWRYLAVEAAGMGSMPDPAPGTATFGYLLIMWSVMMAAMMLPTVLPTISLFARLQGERRRRSERGLPEIATALFVLGYLVAWSAYSVLAATAQDVLQATSLLSAGMVSASTTLTGALLLLAGAYQLTPLKDRCVRHCRSPLSFLTSHWREGAGGALRMGFHHGLYCVGCCWALMALLFALGVMNLFWVLALAALVLVEKAAPRMSWITPVVGMSLLGGGLWVLVGGGV